MSKFYRVYSDSLQGAVFTDKAYHVVKPQLDSLHEVKEISSVEIEPSEKIYDVNDLYDLGYNALADNEEVLTEKSDDGIIDLDEDSLVEGFNENGDLD